MTILALSSREWALCLDWYWGTRRCCSADKSHNVTVAGSVRGWNEKLLERCRGGEQFSALIQGWVCETHTVRPARSAGGGVWGGARVNDRGLSAAHSALFVYNCPYSLAEIDRGKEGREGQRSEGHYVLMALLA